MKCSTSKCQVKCDSVEKTTKFWTLNMTTIIPHHVQLLCYLKTKLHNHIRKRYAFIKCSATAMIASENIQLLLA